MTKNSGRPRNASRAEVRRHRADDEFDTPDGKKGSAYVLMAKEPTNNYLFVIHEW